MASTANVRVDKEVFTPDELEKVLAYYHYMFDDNTIHASVKGYCWQEDVYKQNKADVNVYHLTENMDEDIYQWLSDLLEEKVGLKQIDMRFYQYLPGTSVGWHEDNFSNEGEPRPNGGATIFLQKDWKREYGGLFMWEEHDGSIHAEIPDQNTMVYQRGCHHASTPTYDFSPHRIVLQAFF
jgi:hypothetical protein